MIVADSKPISEVFGFIADYRRVLVLGCGACVTVCQVGGEKEVAVLAQALRLKAKVEGKDIEFLENTVQRQCDAEFVEPILNDLADVDSWAPPSSTANGRSAAPAVGSASCT